MHVCCDEKRFAICCKRHIAAGFWYFDPRQQFAGCVEYKDTTRAGSKYVSACIYFQSIRTTLYTFTLKRPGIKQ
jgi:hypothetical protein